jgi:hypothetical protein
LGEQHTPDALSHGKQELRDRIVESLRAQGFQLEPRSLQTPQSDKETLRQLHAQAVQTLRERARRTLAPEEPKLLRAIANGDEVRPERITPALVEVAAETYESRLFRYACLHWSIPISQGYGRRMRFLVFDESNGKLMGIIGLCDPVFSLRPRDVWVGWSFEQRRQRLCHVMDAFVLGAVPPYNQLLCGKLIAMLATSREVREAFARRYAGRTTHILQRDASPVLALITTTSAFGRSSVYNRLRYHGRQVMESVGFTQGWGTFHFANGLYEAILDYARAHCIGTAKHPRWGGGKFRNRHEVVRRCLQALGLPSGWMRHRVYREIFVAPLGANARAFLRGESSELGAWDVSVADYFAYFRERWLLPRAARDGRYKAFQREQWRLWKDTIL